MSAGRADDEHLRARSWNHNTHYHPVVVRAIPPNCQRALDVGCGRGQLARTLAHHCGQVIAIDVDPGALARARGDSPDARISFVLGDVMTQPFPDDSFDLITAVATLHHLPLEPALVRFRSLLRPGGTLAVIGLYRSRSLVDYAVGAAALPTSWMLRGLRGHGAIGAPVRDPTETLDAIRTACTTLLPGAICRRRLLFRYSLIWRKPRRELS